VGRPLSNPSASRESKTRDEQFPIAINWTLAKERVEHCPHLIWWQMKRKEQRGDIYSPQEVGGKLEPCHLQGPPGLG